MTCDFVAWNYNPIFTVPLFVLSAVKKISHVVVFFGLCNMKLCAEFLTKIIRFFAKIFGWLNKLAKNFAIEPLEFKHQQIASICKLALPKLEIVDLCSAVGNL